MNCIPLVLLLCGLSSTLAQTNVTAPTQINATQFNSTSTQTSTTRTTTQSTSTAATTTPPLPSCESKNGTSCDKCLVDVNYEGGRFDLMNSASSWIGWIFFFFFFYTYQSITYLTCGTGLVCSGCLQLYTLSLSSLERAWALPFPKSVKYLRRPPVFSSCISINIPININADVIAVIRSIVACLWCFPTKRCVTYPATTILPPHSLCPLNDARWGLCTINFQILIITLSVAAAVFIIGLLVCIFCCCKCENAGSGRFDNKMKRKLDKRKTKQEERKAEMKIRHDEMRQKYGLSRASPYARFENPN